MAYDIADSIHERAEKKDLEEKLWRDGSELWAGPTHPRPAEGALWLAFPSHFAQFLLIFAHLLAPSISGS